MQMAKDVYDWCGRLHDKRKALMPCNIQDGAARKGLVHHSVPTLTVLFLWILFPCNPTPLQSYSPAILFACPHPLPFLIGTELWCWGGSIPIILQDSQVEKVSGAELLVQRELQGLCKTVPHPGQGGRVKYNEHNRSQFFTKLLNVEKTRKLRNLRL